MQLPCLDSLPPLIIPEGYQLRSYESNDAKAWVHIMNAAINRVWSEKRFLREIVGAPQFDRERIVIVTYESEPVATACAWTDLAKYPNAGLVNLVAVSPEHRGQSLGRCVTVAALHRIKELGFNEAVLVTDTSRKAAIHLYRSLGFAVNHSGTATQE